MVGATQKATATTAAARIRARWCSRPMILHIAPAGAVGEAYSRIVIKLRRLGNLSVGRHVRMRSSALSRSVGAAPLGPFLRQPAAGREENRAQHQTLADHEGGGCHVLGRREPQ